MAAAMVAAAVGVCLPAVLSHDDPPRERGAIVLMGNTFLVGLVIITLGGMLLALGRIRPTATAFGKGPILGVGVGVIVWTVLLLAWPSPPPADPMLPARVPTSTTSMGSAAQS